MPNTQKKAGHQREQQKKNATNDQKLSLKQKLNSPRVYYRRKINLIGLDHLKKKFQQKVVTKI